MSLELVCTTMEGELAVALIAIILKIYLSNNIIITKTIIIIVVIHRIISTFMFSHCKLEALIIYVLYSLIRIKISILERGFKNCL